MLSFKKLETKDLKIIYKLHKRKAQKFNIYDKNDRNMILCVELITDVWLNKNMKSVSICA